MIDWEDAHRLGIIQLPEAKELLLSFFDSVEDANELNKINTTLLQLHDDNEQIAYLRARAINKLIEKCTDIFWENHKAILQGNFETSLIDNLEGAPEQAMEHLRKKSVQKIYNDRSVVEIEIAGYKVLGGLLEEFVWAILQPESHYSKKLLKLLPQQFVYTGNDIYTRIQSVVDFVAGMTDLYAVELYRKIKGITFPGLK